MQKRSDSSYKSPILPRVIRAKHAPAYLGMCRDVFRREVKPFVTQVPIGSQGIGYDRLELDAWWEHYKESNGWPAKRNMGGSLCQNGNIDDQAFTGAKNANSGLSTKGGEANAYTASLTRIAQMKPKQS